MTTKLVRMKQDGLTEPPIEFYGGKKSDPYGYMSNFSPYALWLPHPFAAPGEPAVRYRTGEHRFQAMKARNESDHDYVNLAISPGDAKARGREINLRDGWDSSHNETLAYYVMVEVVWAKAMAHSEILHSLLKTGGRSIWEDSPTDDIWGIRYRDDYRGKNLLGKAWMQVRDRLYLEQEEIYEAVLLKG
jgi:ribA/ribD-fused uncharacterized protein